MKYDVAETTSKLILNISRLVKYGPYKSFTRSINLDINLTDESPSMYYRQYVILSTMLLTRYLSYASIYPVFARMCNKSKEVIINDVRHFFSLKNDSGCKIQSTVYKNIFHILPDTNGTTTVVELTGNGISYYKELNRLIRFTPEIHKLNDDEIDTLYSASRSKQPGVHYLFTYQVATTFLASLRSNFIEDFTVEAERGDYYDYSFESRKRNRILPDVSMRYRTSCEYLSPVYLEADRSTEYGEAFYNKCRNELNFCSKQTRNNYQFPCMIIYVTDKKKTVKSKVVSMREADRRRKGRFFSRFNDDIFGTLQAAALLYKELNIQTGSPIETIYNLEVTDVLRILKGILSDVTGNEYDLCKQTVTCLEHCIESYKIDMQTDTLLLDDLTKLRDYCNRKSAELLKSNAKIAEEKISASLDSRKFNAAKNLMGRNEQIAYCSGQSLAFVPINELQTAVKSLIPYLAAQPNVKAVASVFGFNGKIKKYWSVHPSCKIGNSYYINKRNSFRFDDTILFFEDLSYDISAIVRLREYLSISPDLIRNTMGCFIVNDDFTVSTGEHIADTFYWRAGKYESDEYHEMFLKRVDANGQAPYFFSIGTDFCIIKRSEFLSGDPSQIHPFVIFGHEESDIIYRTTEGMDSVKPFHMGGMNVYLPITHPEEFDHYI